MFARETGEAGASYAIRVEKTISLKSPETKGVFINCLMISKESNLLVLEDQFRFYDSELKQTMTTHLNQLGQFEIKTVV